jgi:hypothetical protein
MYTPSPRLAGTISSGASFLAILVGLLTADRSPTLIAWLVAVMASIVAGGLAFIQARSSDRERRHLREDVATLRRRLLTPQVELIEPSERAGSQGPEMQIRGRVVADESHGVAAGEIMKERNLEIVPFVKPITTTHLPSKKWWSQNVATMSGSSGEVSGSVRIGSLKYGVGEEFRIVLVIMPHGYVASTDTPYDELPAVAVGVSNMRTVCRLS